MVTNWTILCEKGRQTVIQCLLQTLLPLGSVFAFARKQIKD